MRKKNAFILLTLIFSLCFGFASKKISEVEAGANEYSSPTQKYLSENNDISSFYTSSSVGSVSGLKGDNLLEKLAQIMTVKHRYYTTYGDVRGAMCYSDEDPNDPSKIILFYAGTSFSSSWGSGSNYNREHVWCKTLSGGLYTPSSVDNSSKGAGADIHQLRPSIPSVNTSRSNNLYADLNKTGNELTYNGNGIDCFNSGKGQFEPRDGIKGDIARILMYMYTHYSTEIASNSSRASASNTSTTSQAGDLKINNIVYTSLGTSQASWDVLLSWNELDPVDDFEMNRNNYCASITGVRNPYIDHPEFAKMIWSTSYSGSGALVDNIPQKEYISVPYILKTIEEEETFQILPSTNIDNSNITYSSSNTSIATVSNSGLVTGVSGGKAIITITNKTSTTSFEIVVNPKSEEEVEGIKALYTIVSKNVQTSGITPNSSYATYSQTYTGTSGQIRGGDTASLIISGYEGYVIKGLTLSMKSNKGAGSGSLSVTTSLGKDLASIPDSAFNSSNWNGGYSTSFVDIVVDIKDDQYVIQEDETIAINIVGSTNSLYIASYTITYELPKEEKTLDDSFKDYYSEGAYRTTTSYFFNEQAKIEMARYFNVNLEDNNNKIDLSIFANSNYFASWKENTYEISSIDDEVLLDFVSVISTDLKKIVEDSFYLDISKIIISDESTYLSIKLELSSLDSGKLEDESLTFIEVKVFVEE